jgi:hypothetical protein
MDTLNILDLPDSILDIEPSLSPAMASLLGQPIIDSLDALQAESEELFHKNQLMPRLRAEFTAEPEVTALIEGLPILPELLDPGAGAQAAIELLCQLVLHRQCDITVMVGILRRHFLAYEDDASQACAEFLVACAEHGLCDYVPGTRRLVLVLDVTEDVRAEMDRYQYPLPMVVPPAPIVDSMTTGYLHHRRGSVVLKDNHHDGDFALDHLDRMNQIPLKIDGRVAYHVKDNPKSLDQKKDDETEKDFEDRKRDYKRFLDNAYDVMDRLSLLNDSRFWLTHRYDKRGRTYCQGYYVTYQGRTWNKALIAFAEEEITQ